MKDNYWETERKLLIELYASPFGHQEIAVPEINSWPVGGSTVTFIGIANPKIRNRRSKYRLL